MEYKLQTVRLFSRHMRGRSGQCNLWEFIPTDVVLSVAGLDIPRTSHSRDCSHLPREWPPALAGQTEPSPSSWEVWSPSTSYSRAGKAQSLENEKRRDIRCYSLPYEKQFWLCHCSLRLPGRKKKGENLGSKEVVGLMPDMQNPLPWHPQLQPCTHFSTTMVMLRMELGPSLYQSGAEHDTQDPESVEGNWPWKSNTTMELKVRT